MNNVELPLVHQNPPPPPLTSTASIDLKVYFFSLCVKVWPKHLRDKLKLMPTDTKLIKDIITKIFW